jgi:hypothetical protein
MEQFGSNMSGIVLKTSVVVRTRKGRFPPESYAAVLLPARVSLRRDAERAFATKSDPVSGHPWPPRKYDYPWPPLVESGEMRTAALEATNTAVVTGSSLTVRVRRPRHARFQAKGTKTIAARRFVGASIGTLRIVRAGLQREGKDQALRVLRGKS